MSVEIAFAIGGECVHALVGIYHNGVRMDLLHEVPRGKAIKFGKKNISTYLYDSVRADNPNPSESMEEFEKKLSIRDGEEEEEAAAKKKVSTVELLREFLGIQQRRAEAYAKLRVGFARYMESSSWSSSAESAYQKLCGDVTQEFSDCSRQVLHLESLFLGPHYDRLDLAHLLRAVQTHEKQKLNLTATLQLLKKAGRPSEKPMEHQCVRLHEITEEAEANAQYDIDLKEAIRGVQDSVTAINEHLEESDHSTLKIDAWRK
ncbi:hypothetical protein ACLB2K_073521 [Fragaria x ananassa]